ncbi:MAG: TonB family protein [Bacteroidales bacterium]
MQNQYHILEKIERFINQYQVAIYTTIIFHLLVAILLVGTKLTAVKHRSQLVIEIDYSQQEQQQAKEALEEVRQKMEAEVNKILSESRSNLRNAVVNEEWKPSKGQDKVFEEHEELQRKIEATKKMMQQQEENANQPVKVEKPKKKNEEKYTGPSVLSYKLTGRTARHLPIPAYKCEAGGQVVVNITVRASGEVAAVSIDMKQSVHTDCLHTAAKQAALLSRFSPSNSAQNQTGAITYLFVAQ